MIPHPSIRPIPGAGYSHGQWQVSSGRGSVVSSAGRGRRADFSAAGEGGLGVGHRPYTDLYRSKIVFFMIFHDFSWVYNQG